MDKYYYLILNVLSFIVPFAFSFETKRMHFIQHWKSYFGAIGIVGFLFIVWDVIFTKLGVWGFNPSYLVGWSLFDLPLEEYLFFLLIPFSSNFIHYSLLYFFPKPELSPKTAHRLATFLFLISLALTIGNSDKLYTFYSLGLFSLLMLVQIRLRFQVFRRFVLSFILILIPFILVNGALTGYFTSEPVVWYNNAENLSFRILTIPIEDFFYCFSMLYLSVLLFEWFNPKIRYNHDRN